MYVRTHNPVSFHFPWRYTRRGKADGILSPPVPVWATPKNPPALRELVEAGGNDADILATRWAQLDKRLLGAWDTARTRLDQARADAADAVHALTRAGEAYEDWNGEPAETATGKSARLYAWLVALLGVFEVVFNSIILAATGSNTLENYATAALVTGGLLVCAHYLGRHVRQTETWTAGRVGVAAVLVVIPALAIGSIAYFRSVFVSGDAVVLDGFDLDPATATLAFMAFNAVAFLAATVASYFAHPRGLVELLQTRRDKRRADREVERAAKAERKTRTGREKRFEEAQAELDYIQEAVDQRAERYRRANLSARRDRGEHPDDPHPASFDTPLVVERPAVFDRPLAWVVERPVDVPRMPAVSGDGAQTPAPAVGA